MKIKKELLLLTGLLILVIASVGFLSYQRSALTASLTFAKKPLSTALPTPSPTTPSPFDSAKLEKYLTVEATLLGISDNLSLYFKDEPSDKDIGINPVQSWIPASTIKAFVLPEAFRQRDLGLIDFNETLTIQAQNVVPTELETDEFPRLREGTAATVQQLVEAMIIQSDNTAYNTLLDLLDRRRIKETLKNLSITQTVVGEKLNLDDNQVSLDLQVPGRQPNTTTAKDLATLFDLLYDNKIPHSNEILAIFKRQKINTMIPALLPADTVVAHKTGEWAPIYHDGGIVYKPEDPFILMLFTNANNTAALSQLARVAYYQTASVVGEGLTPQNTGKPQSEATPQRIFLAEVPNNTNVLAAQTTETNANGERIYAVAPGDTLWSIAEAQYGSGYFYVNIAGRNNLQNPGNLDNGLTLFLPPIPGTAFPTATPSPSITAADLGVNINDLHVGKAQTDAVASALVLPSSPFYLIKQWLEQLALRLAQTNSAKADVLLSISKGRLAETKSELTLGNVAQADKLLNQSEEALHRAANLAQSFSNNEVALFKIKELLDLHFGVLNDRAKSLKDNKKEAFIDAVYAFYQKEKAEVAPAVASIKVANPLEQKPLIGTVVSLQNNLVTLKLDDGKPVKIVLTGLTQSRSFEETRSQVARTLTPGERIAAVGQVTPQGVALPEFILRKLPKDLPVGHRGTVIEISPALHTLKLQDTQGKIDTIVIGNNTSIKSKDTNVDLLGIKAGSIVTVVGTIVPPKTAAPTSTLTPKTATSAGLPQGAPSAVPTTTGLEKKPEQGKNKAQEETSVTKAIDIVTKATLPVAPANLPSGLPAKPGGLKEPGPTINASSVTVNKNASGKNERVEKSSKSPSKPSGESKRARPPAAPAPKPVTPESKETPEKK